jgi:sugar lactone lactonase YvrE
MKNDAFIEIFDDTILELLDPETPFHILAEGFVWTEGPLWLEEQQGLIFTDIPNNSIFRIDDKGKLSLYLKPSGYTGDAPRGGEVGANGLTLDPQGRLVMCQHSIDFARDKGYLAMQFNMVVSTNESAVKLWKSFGFSIIGTIPQAFRHQRLGLVDSYIMYKSL